MDNLEIIDNSKWITCWACEGIGIVEDISGETSYTIKCDICKGKGYWKETSYIHIYTDKNGVKQAFQSDFIK